MTLVDLLTALTSTAIGCGLLLSGHSKQRHFVRWWQLLDHYRLLPAALKPLVARGLPVLEMALGAGLLLPWLSPLAAAACVPLFLLFALAISVNWASGLSRFDCGCFFGSHKRAPHAAYLLVRALFLAELATALALLPAAPLAVQLGSLALVAIAALLWLAWQTLRQPSTFNHA